MAEIGPRDRARVEPVCRRSRGERIPPRRAARRWRRGRGRRRAGGLRGESVQTFLGRLRPGAVLRERRRCRRVGCVGGDGIGREWRGCSWWLRCVAWRKSFSFSCDDDVRVCVRTSAVPPGLITSSHCYPALPCRAFTCRPLGAGILARACPAVQKTIHSGALLILLRLADAWEWIAY